jgi:hypothetical protein
MDYVLAPFVWIIGFLFQVVFWVLGKLIWIVIWLLLPVFIVAFIALRVAERVRGQEAVRAWVKARTIKYGTATWHRARRLTFALGALPVRVLFWFVIYTIWHSIVGLLWRPRWTPWGRAWSKRWRPRKAETAERSRGKPA